jgi:agmatinase
VHQLAAYFSKMRGQPYLNSLLWLLSSAPLIAGHAGHHHHEGPSLSPERLAELEAKWGTDFSFTGISTFAHLPYVRCLTDPTAQFDIGIIGAPFDTAVSYRPGTGPLSPH